MIKGLEGRREKELGEDNSAVSLPTPLLPVLLTQQYQGPFLSLQKQTTQRASQSPQKAQVLQTNRHRAVARFWAVLCCISSFSQFPLPRNLSPTCPHQFCIFHSSTERLCAQIRMCACTHIHPPVTDTLLASSAIIIQSCPCSIRQERNKSKGRNYVWSEEGSYKDKRSHLQSQPHQSMQKLNSLSFVLWFTEDDKSGGLWLKICGKEGSQEKRPFLFLRGGIDSSIYFNYLQCFISF